MDNKIFFPIIDNGQGSVKANFMVCCLNAFHGYDVFFQRYSDSLVPRARNRAAATFLRGKRDYLLFIDTDIVFTKDHIDCLMQSDDPIVCGIYCKKESDVAPCYNLLPDQNNVPVGGLIEIARNGTGFMRIHREVLIRMKENPTSKCHVCESIHWTNASFYKNHGDDEWDFFPDGVKNHEYLSEDWFFCDRARALGYKVLLDTRIQTKHEGTTFYPTDEAVERQMAKEKAMLANGLLTPEIVAQAPREKVTAIDPGLAESLGESYQERQDAQITAKHGDPFETTPPGWS